MTQATQILVVGGGPAGSTAAALLAREGFRVTLLERERFPRYHVGESILPSCLPILDLLGAREKVERHGFRRKGGAYFEWGEEQWELSFGALRGEAQYSWQVIRSEFDQILLEHARSLGVDVRERTTVKDVVFDGEGRATAAQWASTDGARGGTISFDHLVDASGRAGLMATRHLNNRTFHDAFRNVGIWGYWDGARPLPRGPDGAIGVCSIPEGWFWLIPLHDGSLSVGLVTSKACLSAQRAQHGGLPGFYHAKLQSCRLAREVLGQATLASPLRVEADYSYAARSFSGPGWMLAGDAACFLDPLLSTGVHLATFSGMLAAASLSSTLRGHAAEDAALRFYSQAYRHAYERLLVLVSVFYQSYKGRDAHFFEAQALTRQDRIGLELQESFLNIVSGMEDIVDAHDGAYDVIASTLRGAHTGVSNPLANHNYRSEALPTDAGSAVAGFYLVTEPQLGLQAA